MLPMVERGQRVIIVGWRHPVLAKNCAQAQSHVVLGSNGIVLGRKITVLWTYTAAVPQFLCLHFLALCLLSPLCCHGSCMYKRLHKGMLHLLPWGRQMQMQPRRLSQTIDGVQVRSSAQS